MRRVGEDARGGRGGGPHGSWRAPAHGRCAAATLVLACLAWGLTLAPAARAIPAGYVAVAGYDQYGELGDGQSTRAVTSLETSASFWGPELVTQMAASDYNSYAVLANGTVQATGSNENGSLGRGTTTPAYISVPTVIPRLAGVTQVASGYDYFGLALLSNGTVDGWGYGYYGELGNGRAGAGAEETSPVPVAGLEHVSQIAAGGYCGMALLTNGTVEMWGADFDGELGNGSTQGTATPTLVPGLSGVVAIAAGYDTSYALLADGKVMAWGLGQNGELGNGTATEKQTTPIEVKGLEGVSAISAGAESGYALLANGTVKAWGHNSFAELGDGTTTERREPVPIPGLSGVRSITAGSNAAYATIAGGTVEDWGYGAFGELANGKQEAAAETKTPTPISGLTGVISIATGDYNSDLLAIVGASASLSGTALTFANQPVGGQSAAQTVTLTNEGPAPLKIAGDVLTGTGAAAFAATGDTCQGATIAAGSSCSVSLAFKPAAAGSQDAALAFSTTAANALGSVALNGVGVSIACPLSSSSPPCSGPPHVPSFAPVLGNLSLSPPAFRAAKSGASVTAARTAGTIVSYSDSEVATTTFSVQQTRRGILRGTGRRARCVAAPNHPRKRARKRLRRCTFTRALGSFTHADTAGSNRFRFTGRVHGRTLKPGRYHLVAVARAAGLSSTAKSAGFKIVKRSSRG